MGFRDRTSSFLNQRWVSLVALATGGPAHSGVRARDPARVSHWVRHTPRMARPAGGGAAPRPFAIEGPGSTGPRTRTQRACPRHGRPARRTTGRPWPRVRASWRLMSLVQLSRVGAGSGEVARVALRVMGPVPQQRGRPPRCRRDGRPQGTGYVPPVASPRAGVRPELAATPGYAGERPRTRAVISGPSPRARRTLRERPRARRPGDESRVAEPLQCPGKARRVCGAWGTLTAGAAPDPNGHRPDAEG